MARSVIRAGLRATRAVLSHLDGSWRHLIVAALVGVLGALAVEGFRWVLFALEAAFVGAHGGLSLIHI